LCPAFRKVQYLDKIYELVKPGFCLFLIAWGFDLLVLGEAV